MINVFIWTTYISAGLLAASNLILWGIYGDLMMEDFKWLKVLRTLLVGAISATFLFWTNPFLPLLVVALDVNYMISVFTEIYKAFIRNESQERYLIPSDFGSRIPLVIRRPIGILILIATLVFIKYIPFSIDPLAAILLAAIIPTFYGASKDAPHEGFEPVKFFRSPIVALVTGFFLYKLLPGLDSKLFLFAVLGAERLISECYKKVINSHIPGKFKMDKTHTISLKWKKARKIILLPYFATMAIFVILALQTAGAI